MNRVLIIGAGLSGLVAGRELQRAGCEVLLLEREARVGGRLLTEEFDGARFDSGAQFFTARSLPFKYAVAGWEMRGVARRWFEGYLSPRGEQSHDVYTRFCIERGMMALAEYLSRQLAVQRGKDVTSLRFNDGEWRARTASGEEYSGNQLVLTAPLPLSLKLWDTSGKVLPTAQRKQLESVRYDPCLSLLVHLQSASKIPSPGALYLNEEPISFIADNHQKGIAAREGAVTIHSTAAFAKEYFDSNEDVIARLLLDAAQQYSRCPVQSFQVRRWKYSKAENALNVGALHLPELHLCFAGDGLSGARVEGAFFSGMEAARAMSGQATG